MSATGRNITKIVVGSAIGSAVAAVVAKLVNEDDTPAEERVPFTEKAKNAPIRLRERWEDARAAGAAAEEHASAHLTEIFRSKVNDPDALKPPRPPSR